VPGGKSPDTGFQLRNCSLAILPHAVLNQVYRIVMLLCGEENLRKMVALNLPQK
jgi:hypothetical protein